MGEAGDVARSYFAVIDTRDPENCRPLLADSYTYTGADGGTQSGPQAAVDVMAMYLNAFPDLSVDLHTVHESGGTAILEFTATGTHTGALAGVPPTGKRIAVRVCNVLEVRDGRIVAEREYFNELSLMQQLGLVPEHAIA